LREEREKHEEREELPSLTDSLNTGASSNIFPEGPSPQPTETIPPQVEKPDNGTQSTHGRDPPPKSWTQDKTKESKLSDPVHSFIPQPERLILTGTTGTTRRGTTACCKRTRWNSDIEEMFKKLKREHQKITDKLKAISEKPSSQELQTQSTRVVEVRDHPEDPDKVIVSTKVRDLEVDPKVTEKLAYKQDILKGKVDLIAKAIKAAQAARAGSYEVLVTLEPGPSNENPKENTPAASKHKYKLLPILLDVPNRSDANNSVTVRKCSNDPRDTSCESMIQVLDSERQQVLWQSVKHLKFSELSNITVAPDNNHRSKRLKGLFRQPNFTKVQPRC